MAYHGYEEVDHTADIALHAWGENFESLLEHAAYGLYDLMGVELDSEASVETQFEVPQGALETVLVDFLSELLYLAEEQELACKSFSFLESDDQLLINTEGKQILSRVRYIKAVTFHDLNVEKNSKGVEATITFDV